MTDDIVELGRKVEDMFDKGVPVRSKYFKSHVESLQSLVACQCNKLNPERLLLDLLRTHNLSQADLRLLTVLMNHNFVMLTTLHELAHEADVWSRWLSIRLIKLDGEKVVTMHDFGRHKLLYLNHEQIKKWTERQKL